MTSKRPVAIAAACVLAGLLTKPLPAEPPAAHPIRTVTYAVTITVWSDGSTETGEFEELTLHRARQVYRRLEDQAEDARTARRQAQTDRRRRAVDPRRPDLTDPAPANAKQAGYRPGEQCHAEATSTGNRCKRAAKGDSGFCWQHRDALDVYPD